MKSIIDIILNYIRKYLKDFIIYTALKLTGFRAWIAGVFVNKIIKLVEKYLLNKKQEIKDKENVNDLLKEINKPKDQQNEEKIIESGKNVLEGN